MSLTLITGPANSAKARRVLDACRQAIEGEPILVVPTRADVEHYRRELATDGMVFGVRVERFAGLIGEIALRAGPLPPLLGRAARTQVLRVAVADAALSTLRPVAPTAGFVDSLGHLVAELQAQRLDPSRLRQALRAWAGADAARRAYGEEVAALYAGYRSRLDVLGVVDGEGHATRALDALREQPWRWGRTPVLFYGFDDLTSIELDAVETLARVVDVPVTFTLAYEAGRAVFAGRASAFETLAPLAGRVECLEEQAAYYHPSARRALHHLERGLFEPTAARVDPGPAVRLLEGGGERAELELVAQEIAGLIDGGMPAQDIALIRRSSERSCTLVEELLSAHSIAYSLRRRVTFGHTTLGGALLSLLRCALGAGSAEDLLRWLRYPGVVGHSPLVDRLEAEVRRHGLRSAVEARARWERAAWPLETLDRLRAAGQGGSLALLERVGVELDVLAAAGSRRQAPVLPTDEAQALVGARRALEDLGDLARRDRLLGPDGAGLITALEELPLMTGEPPGPGRVTVCDPLALRARRVGAIFVCGLNAGTFPAPGRPEPFFSDEERRDIALSSGLVLRRSPDSLSAERYLFYATVSRPVQLLVLSSHSADDDGDPVVRSLFVDDVADRFTEALAAGTRHRRLGEADAPSAPEDGGSRAIAPLGSPAVLTALRDQPAWSASALETWAGCPVKWFVERFLNARDLEPEPEGIMRGGLAHAVMEATLRSVREQTGSAGLEARGLPEARRLLHRALQDAAADFPLSTDPVRLRTLRRRLERDLERYLEHLAACVSIFVPTHLELGFGFGEGSLPALELDDGRLRLRGRIDRVDLDAGGRRAIVYDYKGRDAPQGARWLSDHRFQVAIYARAVRELLGLDIVGGLYQPLGTRDLRARGVLDSDADPDLDCVGRDATDRAGVDALMDASVAQAVEAATQARAGALVPRPDTCAYRGGCSYPALCRCEPGARAA